MKFRTKFDEHARFESCSGSEFVPTYELGFGDNGCQELIQTGTLNIYKKIQSFKETTDLATILRNIDPVQLNNAVSTLRVEDLDKSAIIDLTMTPSTLGDALNRIKSAENIFNGLPLEVRKEFNYSPQMFIKSFGSEPFNKAFGLTPKAPNIVNNIEKESE